MRVDETFSREARGYVSAAIQLLSLRFDGHLIHKESKEKHSVARKMKVDMADVLVN